MKRIKEITEASRIVVSTPVQRREPFQPWEIRRIKYEYLLRKPVEKDDTILIDVGYLSGTNKIGQSSECRIIEAEPEREEVQVTPKTKVEIKYIQL
jgi:hypothetical protein